MPEFSYQLVVAAVFIVPVIFVVFPDALTSNALQSILFLVAAIPIFSYAGFWAFSIRQALAVRLYRRQAFGVGFVVLAMFFTFAVFALVPGTANLEVAAGLTNSAFYLLFFVMFYWLDTSILATHRADPLLRDTLHWSKI